MRNVHERRIPAEVGEAAALLDGLSSSGDRPWPVGAWPPMRLDHGLAPGSRGGHASIRYTVEAYEPGRRVRFRFDPSTGLDGTHEFDVRDEADGTVRFRHVIDARPERRMRFAWPLAVRWLHDALVEDALDSAEAELSGSPRAARRHTPWVRVLRRGAELASRKPEPESVLEDRRVVADLTASTLVAAALLHAAWAGGSSWPAGSRGSLARSVVGTETFPSAGASAAVAGLLGAAALLVEARVRPRGALRRLPFPVVDLGVKAVGGVLLARGAGGLVLSAAGVGSPTPPFRARNLTVYSPLCLALTWGVRRTVRRL